MVRYLSFLIPKKKRKNSIGEAHINECVSLSISVTVKKILLVVNVQVCNCRTVSDRFFFFCCLTFTPECFKTFGLDTLLDNTCDEDCLFICYFISVP